LQCSTICWHIGDVMKMLAFDLNPRNVEKMFENACDGAKSQGAGVRRMAVWE